MFLIIIFKQILADYVGYINQQLVVPLAVDHSLSSFSLETDPPLSCRVVQYEFRDYSIQFYSKTAKSANITDVFSQLRESAISNLLVGGTLYVLTFQTLLIYEISQTKVTQIKRLSIRHKPVTPNNLALHINNRLSYFNVNGLVLIALDSKVAEEIVVPNWGEHSASQNGFIYNLRAADGRLSQYKLDQKQSKVELIASFETKEDHFKRIFVTKFNQQLLFMADQQSLMYVDFSLHAQRKVSRVYQIKSGLKVMDVSFDPKSRYFSVFVRSANMMLPFSRLIKLKYNEQLKKLIVEQTKELKYFDLIQRDGKWTFFQNQRQSFAVQELDTRGQNSSLALQLGAWESAQHRYVREFSQKALKILTVGVTFTSLRVFDRLLPELRCTSQEHGYFSANITMNQNGRQIHERLHFQFHRKTKINLRWWLLAVGIGLFVTVLMTSGNCAFSRKVGRMISNKTKIIKVKQEQSISDLKQEEAKQI